MKTGKKGLRMAGRGLGLALLLGLCYLLFGGALLNDFRAWQIEKELCRLELPADAELIEAASFVGNTGGTGNHVEIWAGILVRSSLSLEELESYFAGRADVSAVPQDLTAYLPYDKDFMDFHALEGAASGDGYFVIGGYFEAFTQIDLRGR